MNLSPLPIQKFFANNGRPLAGGKLFTYVNGTTTKIATYVSTSGAANANPIVLDFRGECRIWIDPTKSYTFVLAPSSDTDPPTNPIWTVNDITAAPFAFDNSAVDTGSVNNIALAIPQISSPVAFTRIVFQCANTNTGATTISINGGTAKALTWQSTVGLTKGEIVAGGIYQAVFDGAQWQLQGPALNPGDIRLYGASPSASASVNTTAIQAAIDRAESGGPPVYVPAGTYSITSLTHDSTNGITIYGDGDAQSILQGANAGTAILLLVQHPSFTAINGFRMYGVGWDANSGGQLDAGAVQLNNAVAFDVYDCAFYNATRTSGASGVNGVACSVGSTTHQGPAGTIRNCHVYNTSKGGVNITSECVGVVVDGCLIHDITGNGTAPGIQVNGAFGSRLVNNEIYNTQGRGIFMATDSLSNAPTDTVVADNVIYNTGTGSSEGSGIALTRSFGSAAGRIIIANNRIRNAGVNMSDYGIYLSSDANVTVVGNHVSACKLYGLRVQTCSDINITGNTFDANNTSNTAGVGGIEFDGTCDRINVVGNTSTDTSGSPKQVYGLECAASAVLTKFNISGNNFYGNVTQAVAFNSTPKESTIDVVVEKQTTDGSANTALVFVLADQTTLSVNVRSTADQSDFSNRAFYQSDGLFYRSGGGATVQGVISNLTTIESDAAWGGNLINVAANSAIVQIQGKAATTVNWRTRIQAQTV